MANQLRLIMVVVGLACTHPVAALAEEWSGFRGPHGTGVSNAKNMPVKWGEKSNIAWKTPLPGPGASSPIAWADHVFVTCWSGYAEGKDELGDMKNLKRHLVCIDRKSGKQLWKASVPAKLPDLDWTRAVRQHGYTTSTPVTDGERVIAFFGKSGVYAFDFKGNQLWRADTGKYTNEFGSGASPSLWKNLVFVNASVEGGGLVALDKKTGERKWRVKIADDCWSTPTIVDLPNKKQELVLLTPALLFGYDPATGKELWRCKCDEPDYISATPVVRNGVVFVMGSGRIGKVCMAVRAGGRGDVTKTHIVWSQKVGASYTSPVLAGDYLYFFSRLAYCLDIKTGKVVFSERLSGLGREYTSPIMADGKIYMFTRYGPAHVLQPGKKLKQLGRNDLGVFNIVASPAAHRGQILIRTHRHLICIGSRKK